LDDDEDMTSTIGTSPELSVPSGASVAEVPVAAAPALADAALNGLPGLISGQPPTLGSTGSAAPVTGVGSTVEGGASPASPAPAEIEVARVTGLSFVLDVFEVGAGIGLNGMYGLVISGIGTVVPTDQLPPELVNQAFEILAVPPAVFDQFAAPTTEGFVAFRAAIAPLAAANPGANALLRAMSEALIRAGTEGSALVNPLDAQVVQLGQFLLVLQEDG
jgi:hypothetical protein